MQSANISRTALVFSHTASLADKRCKLILPARQRILISGIKRDPSSVIQGSESD